MILVMLSPILYKITKKVNSIGMFLFVSGFYLIKYVLNHFGYNESQFDRSDVYTGHRKKTVNEIFEKIALANLLGSDKKVRVTIEYDPNYEDFLLLVTDT